MNEKIALALLSSAVLAASVSPAAPQTPAKPAGKSAPALVEMAGQVAVGSQPNDTLLGYSIQFPKGATVEKPMPFIHNYVAPYNSLQSYVAKVYGRPRDGGSRVSPRTLEDTVLVATEMGTKELVEKRAIEGGFLVVKKPEGIDQEAWVFKTGKKGQVQANCIAPTAQADALIAICSSLKIVE